MPGKENGGASQMSRLAKCWQCWRTGLSWGAVGSNGNFHSNVRLLKWVKSCVLQKRVNSFYALCSNGFAKVVEQGIAPGVIVSHGRLAYAGRMRDKYRQTSVPLCS